MTIESRGFQRRPRARRQMAEGRGRPIRIVIMEKERTGRNVTRPAAARDAARRIAATVWGWWQRDRSIRQPCTFLILKLRFL